MITTLLISLVNATPENAEKTGKDCSYCHPDGPPALGEAGLYFQEHRTLEGFVETDVQSPQDDVEIREIGVHLDQWDVAIICFLSVLLVIAVVYISGL